MDSLLDLLATLSIVQLGVGIAVTAAIVAIVLDWRISLGSVLLQFFFASLLLNTELPAGLAMVKLIAGAVACVMLYWTARQVQYALDEIEGGQAWFRTNSEIYPMGLPFRFLSMLFTALVLVSLPELFQLPFLPRTFLVPAMWLIAMGLLTIILTRDPLKTGMGLLTFQNGFELLYHLAEPGLVVMGLLSIGTILVGFVASYLAIARHLPLIEARRSAQSVADPRSPEALAQAVATLDQRNRPSSEAAVEPDDEVKAENKEEIPA